MDGTIRCEVFGVKVPAGKTVAVGSDESDSSITTVQITQVALGESAADGRHVVYMSDGKASWVIGSLTRGLCEQFQTDFMGRHKVTLRHTGRSDIFVSGFKTVTMLDDEEGSDEEQFESGEDDEDEDEDEDEEDEEPGTKMLLGNGRPQAKPGKSPAKPAPQLVADEADDDDDEDDDDEGLEGEEFSDMDDDEEDDEDEDEDEDEEDEEEEAAAQPAPQKKRPAAAAAVATPAKKAKAEAGGGADDSAKYEKALRDFLKKEGPTSLSTLGSKVPGKPGNIKMKKFLEERPNLFKLDAAGLVSVAK